MLLGLLFVMASWVLMPVKSVDTHEPDCKVEGPGPVSDTITMFFAGDMMGHQGMITAAWNQTEKKYSYSHWFRYVRPHIEAADFAVANLEVTLAGVPYKGYPQFSSPDPFAAGLKDAGLDLLITANNHSQDRGRRGLERTLRILDSVGIPHTGTFRDASEREKNYPWINSVRGMRIAVLNATYGTNGLVVQKPNIVNLIDTAEMRRDIRSARQRGAQFIIVTLHWGLEYQRQESPEQMRLARWLAEKGADAIIGMHPHVVQPMKVLTDPRDTTRRVPVAFSLGNYISNQRERFRDGGIGLMLRVVVTGGIPVWHSWGYIPVWCQAGGLPFGFYPVPVSRFEKNSASFNLTPNEAMRLRQFAADTRSLLQGVPEFMVKK